MAKLIYSAFTSLDGYVADETGNFEWAELDEEVFDFINQREGRVGTYLFGRKVYETMAVWETPEVIPNPTAGMLAYVPIWQAAEKVVYSTTPADGLGTQDAARAEIRRGRCAGAEGGSDPRPCGGGCDARRACHSRRPGR